MSYSIFCDGELIYMPSLQKYALDDAVLEQVVNTSGSLNFTMPDSHPMIGKIPALTAVVEVKKGSRVVFRGRPIKGSDNFYLQNTVICEGVMGYFNDTYIDPFEFSGTPQEFLRKIVSEHNAQVEDGKQFIVGIVTVVDSNDFIVRSSEYPLKTMEVIMTRMVESSTGGYVRIRYEADGNYVDWLSDFTEESSQTIEFGQNLIDYLNEIDSTSIVTAIIPLGAMIDGTNNRVTIESVNNGSKSIIDSEAVYQYGYIYATVEWDDITVPANLLQAAKNYLKAQKYARQTITLTALDLSLMDKSIDSFDCCEYVRAKSKPHALDEKMLISQKTTDIIHPENGQITIGQTKSTASGNNRKSQASARETAQMVIKINGDYVPNIALQESKEYLTSLISQTESNVNISVEQLRTRLDQLQAEYDGSAEIYFSDEIPNINNYPAINWWTWVYPDEKYPEPDLANRYFTELDQKTHLGALCYYTTETETSVFRWILSPDGEYKWQEIPQTEMTLLLQRVGELEIDMDQVQASVSSINLTYVSKEELESSLTVLSNEISLDVKGKYATLSQMTDAEAKIDLKVGVDEGGKMISAINAAADSVTIDAKKVKINGGVTFENFANGLFNGTTKINGNCLETGSIITGEIEMKNLKLTGGSIHIKCSDAENDIIQIEYNDRVMKIRPNGIWAKNLDKNKAATIQGGGLYLYNIDNGYSEFGCLTHTHLQFLSSACISSTESDKLYIASSSTIGFGMWLESVTNYSSWGGYSLHPAKAGYVALGYPGAPWSGVYSQNSPVISSDARYKTDFSRIGDDPNEDWVGFFNDITPESYILKSDNDRRRRIGFVAQKILSAMQNNGIDPDTYGIITVDDDGFMSLSYDMLFTIAIFVVQKQMKEKMS